MSPVPWHSAWPAGVALLVLVLGLGLARRSLVIPRRWWGVIGVLGFVGLAVRLMVVPALARHEFDGHEAEYHALFLGEALPTAGGTLMYPAMQWFWWGLGQVLPAHPLVPVVLMALVGVLGAGLVGAMVGTLSNGRAGLIAAGLVLLHPAHAAWSSSSYNVILPATFSALGLFCVARSAKDRSAPWGLGVLGGAALALTVATRLEAGVVAVPCVLIFALVRPQGMGWRAAWRTRARQLPGLALGAGLAIAAARPLLAAGEVPGAGERALSFAMHIGWLAPYRPFDAPFVWVLLAGLAAAAFLRRPLATVALLALAGVVHPLMASFDDFADRHALMALPTLAFVVGLGTTHLLDRTAERAHLIRRLAATPAVLLGLVLFVGLADMNGRFYGPEHGFKARLDGAKADGLPVWTLAQAKVRDGAACGWVNEDWRAQSEPVASHFNLIDAGEAAGLRGPTGCLRWCADMQDWRWSSRGVRDRAFRVLRLYEAQTVAVVAEPTLGYGCLVYELGRRRCCGTADAGDSHPGTGGRPARVP